MTLRRPQIHQYQVGLRFVGWFQAQPAGATLSSRLFRQLDKLGTSVVLNIAEGNGRYLGVALMLRALTLC